ncbi:hypothetical protein ACWD6Z_35570, partial [Streptomyces californicus]
MEGAGADPLDVARQVVAEHDVLNDGRPAVVRVRVGAPVTPKLTTAARSKPVPTNDWWSSLAFQRY